ncbi:endonuclease domain-containing 1 protein-like [Sinocyclocheilus anshuiensis]|uniref:endonuclease domain-containing 1 protein-like n=1 Tax=Sinocyclocheilus anshuiensis TaxID=1608454 RepID=UPI0007BA9DDB|nr:PREDICTED: endonuclease domain-containing 1 protein-like [Sinocyclocheilus anshuiensis]
MDPDAMKICQKLENEESDHTAWYSSLYYATLYSVHHKIPLYSAYTLDPRCAIDTGGSNIWHLEPQISHPQSPIDHMVREDQYYKYLYKRNQAISSDYSGTGYDRGHLNPNCFQCGDGRKATFALTNAAPMKERFNRVHWRNWENTLRRFLKGMLDRDGGFATAYIVTGTVPDPNVRIPHRGTPGDRFRVSVPSHIWTAVCYEHDTDDRKSLSFGYIGRNQPEEPDIRLMSVSDLNDQLSRLYRELSGTQQSIEIFVDDCFGYNNKFEVHGAFKKLINISPGISLTDNGQMCLYDHPCATYDYDYYWCKTSLGYIKDDWDYCSLH